MSEYVICPKCELNYMHKDESCCKVCNPKSKGKLITDFDEKHETFRQKKMQEYQTRKEAMNAFYAVRYNCKHK